MTDTRIDSDILFSLPFNHYQRYALTKRMVISLRHTNFRELRVCQT